MEKAAKTLHKLLAKHILNNAIIFKPVPSPISKIKNKYRWRIIIKTILSNNIINSINNALQEYYAYNYKSTRVIVDTNPNNMN